MKKKRLSWKHITVFRLDWLLNATIFLIAFSVVFRDPVPRGFTLLQLVSIGSLTFLILNKRHLRLSQDMAIYVTILAAMIFWALVTTLISLVRGVNDFVQGLRDIRDFAIFAYLAILLIFLSPKQSNWQAMTWGGALGMAVEILLRNWPTQYLGFFDRPFQGVRYVAGFVSPNAYSAYASIILTAAFWCLWVPAKRRWHYIIPLVISFFVLVSTASRGGLIGSVVGLLTVLFSRQTLKPLNVLFLIVCVAGLLFVYSTDMFGAQYYVRRFSPTFLVQSFQERIHLNQVAWRIIREYPVLGAGWGGFASLNARFGGTGTGSPHNELIKAWTDSGLTGVVIMVLVLFYPLKVCLKRPIIKHPILAIYLAFLVSEIFFSHLARPSLSLICAMLLGDAFGAGLGHNTLQGETQEVTNAG